MLFAFMALGWTISSSAAVIAKDGPTASQPTGDFWQDVGAANGRTAQSASTSGPRRFHAASLNRNGLKQLAKSAPLERTDAAAVSPLIISLPHPDGGYQRFAIVDSPIMEAGLAAKHPEIKTYAGKGIDDPNASLRMDITPLGLHASVRTPTGAWYVDPQTALDDSVYNSYHSRDLVNSHGALREAPLTEAQIALSQGFYHADDKVEVRGAGFTPGASVTVSVRNEGDSGTRQSVVVTADAEGVINTSLVADPSRNTGAFEVSATDGNSTSTVAYHVVDDQAVAGPTSGNQLRTYRLALVTDPSYATYFGGSANVTAAKVTLINRVTQVYEDETAIRLMLINNTDALNLDTAAQMTGANGPCGATACYTATQAASCGSGTLSRNRVVAGLLAGAGNFDVGHIALGLNGGGIASLGVVGGNSKAQGCTGIPTPVGDFYAVDYVAHELGHQFSGNHTFNGVISNCSGGNRNAGTSVEPGSGSSIMAYAGICGTDNLQTHSDAYWSQRSFDEIVAYTSGSESAINEVQMLALTNFGGTQQFKLRYNGNDSAAIIRGTNFTTAGIKAAIQGISGWPAGATVTVSSLSDAAATITFGGTLAGTNVPMLELVNCSGGCSGYVGEIASGGATTRRGSLSFTGNTTPVVSVPASYTIPVRTPFALTGSATDGEGDTLTYLWEQNDRASGTGTGLISNTKTNGPLFRQFGVQAVVSNDDTIKYGSPGENHVTTNPTRVFPDLTQILSNNTNAETGVCPTAAASPTAADIACFSEFLPTADYVGFGANASPAALNFRLTARDGRGGVGNASTKLVLAPNAGPFLVTSPNSAVSLDGGSTQTVTWSVANTDVAPVNTANVKISLSTDGGNTYPYTLAASTANNGSKAVTLPLVASTTARIKVEAIDNVFFDVSNANFTIRLVGDVNGDGTLNCDDLAIIKAALGKRTGQAGYDVRADLNKDGVVDARDLAAESQRIPGGCRL
ncbi:M12 family metallo-peptidase [Duganella sp. S19_KUP01_CR8]|uniref:M12 family metallo-peptidase n=1 Tax=Duganella sp. S19_KUP01_CR8 TaxID=3025502 RepID=UPI002FCD819C